MIGGKDYSQQLGLTLKTRVQPLLQVPRLLLAPLRAGLRGVLPGCFKFQQSPVFKNNGPVVRRDAPEMLPSDVMFYFLWFLRCFCVFFICLCHVISRLFFKNFERNFHGTTVSRMSHGATAKCIFLNVGCSFATVKWHFLPTLFTFFWTWIFHIAVTSCCTGPQRNEGF